MTDPQACRLPGAWPESLRQSVSSALSSGRMTAAREALQALAALPAATRGQPLKLSIARTFTVEAQVDFLKLALATIPCSPDIRVGALANLEPELLDPRSPLLAGGPDAVLILWRLEDLHERFVTEGGSWTADERSRAADDLIGRIRSLCEGYARASRAPLFLSTLPPVHAGRALLDLHLRHGIQAMLQRINREILDLASESRQIHVFDLAGWAAHEGRSAFDAKMDFYARQPIAAASLPSFALALRRTLAPLVRPRAKVLALDLDNTLWGGVVGEDGIGNLKIGHEFPGNVYLAIQRAARALRDDGVLLALISKNNPADVEEAFSTIPSLALSLSDFATVRVNWNHKHENLADIARELNLGIDSFVFVDDQAFEREEVAFHLPQVRVLPVGEDPLSILRAILEMEDFDALRVSGEDRGRAADYAAQRERRNLEEQSGGVEAFLHSLNLEAAIEPVGDHSMPRVVQMLGKTNQFNLTARRHSEAKVRAICSAPGATALTVALRDRFGDQGIVGVLLAHPADRGEVLHIDSFLLSCRAIGRGAELALWSELLRRASAGGFRQLTAEYVATEKNAQVADLFDRLGMTCSAGDDKHRTYEMALPAAAPVPAWITVNEVVTQ